MFDYLIVGQGLAGTILAHTLTNKGKKLLVIDNPELSACSRVAAGNYNPIVFKRLVKSWMADEVIPFADQFYSAAQDFLNSEFFWKKEIMKIFADEREKKFWEKKSKEDEKYLCPAQNHNPVSGIKNKANGFGIVKDAGKIYAARFLEEFRNYFLKDNRLAVESFEFGELKFSGNGIHYKDISAGKIIFCEGWMAMRNPYFSFLPFKPAKGEILILKIENFKTEKILHKNGYLYQIGENLFVAGTTYEWNELNDLPGEHGKNAIIEKVKMMIDVPFEIIGHFAGVRPSTRDRRPFIGLHPEHKSVGIFNGFGTKAVMLAPYFAKEYYHFLEHNKPLSEEVNIKRFYH